MTNETNIRLWGKEYTSAREFKEDIASMSDSELKQNTEKYYPTVNKLRYHIINSIASITTSILAFFVGIYFSLPKQASINPEGNMIRITARGGSESALYRLGTNRIYLPKSAIVNAEISRLQNESNAQIEGKRQELLRSLEERTK